MATTNTIYEAVRQLQEGLSGLRRLLYHLNYDYADALLPLDPASPFNVSFATAPRRVATACSAGFSVLWFPMRQLDAEAERRICSHYSRLYPYALFLFSNEDYSVWRFACVPDDPQADTDYAFAVDPASLTPRIVERLSLFKLEEDDNDVNRLQVQMLEACTVYHVKATFYENSRQDYKNWQDSVTWWLQIVKKYPRLTTAEEYEIACHSTAGDQGARERLILSSLWIVIYIARKYVCPSLLLPDLLQDGHLALLRASESYTGRDNCKFSTYAAACIHNAMRDTWRNHERFQKHVLLMDFSDVWSMDVGNEPYDQSNDPERVLMQQASEEQWITAVQSLPAHLRVAVLLCDVEEKSYEEVACIMNCPLGTVRSRIHRGRQRLQAAAETMSLL